MWSSAKVFLSLIFLGILSTLADAGVGAVEKPGPSATLFAAPFYSCARNFYVDATNGNDANAGTQDAPWKTIQRADSAVQAGDCVNVQPGTYPSGANITRGGNAPPPGGYVVYRCAELNACQIAAAGFARGGFKIAGPNGVGPGFVVIDGFELAANGYYTYSVGISVGDIGRQQWRQ